MKHFFKENYIFLLFVLFGGLFGGYFIGIYSYDSLSLDVLKQLEEQNVTKNMVIISTIFQYGILFGFLLACIGIILSKKIKLWVKFKFDKKAVILTSIITVISALVLYPFDKLVFGLFNSWVYNQYIVHPTIYKIIGGLLVGGIIEEIMMRLFLMSLLVIIISKIFYKSKKEIPVRVYVIANIISAFLFALGHIPATILMTSITPVLLVKCFMLNGLLGMSFGYLYRKYGIEYAMIAHGFSHLLSDILMIIFI